jgi:hypothetical protein
MTNDESTHNIDAGPRMELEHAIWSRTIITHAIIAEAYIDLMWQNYQHTPVFTKNMSTINKAPTSSTHSNPTRVQDLTKRRWKFFNWEVDDSCSIVNMNIGFNAWQFNVINLSPKACHHMVQSLPKKKNVLCEDHNSSPSTYRYWGYANAIQHVKLLTWGMKKFFT